MIEKMRGLFLSNYEVLLGLLASIMVFRQPGTIGIIVFLVLHLLVIKQLRWDRKKAVSVALIALPFLLDVLFIWNNDVIPEGFKQMEKRMSLFLFPVLMILSPQKIQLPKVLKVYTVGFVTVLIVLFIRHVIVDADLIAKYIRGVDLWQVGYSFANSTKSHGPALNLHVAFLTVSSFYLLIQSLWSKKTQAVLGRSAIFVLSLFFLLYINTRLAVVLGICGIFLLLFIELTRKITLQKTITITATVCLLLSGAVYLYTQANPYMIKKFTERTFRHMDKVNQLDDFEDPEGEIYSALVTRVSIWNTALDTALQHPWIGAGAADGKDRLNAAYVATNQAFLAKYKFPTHNQYIDFFLKFGVLGLLGTILFMLHIFWLAWKSKSGLALFFAILFTCANLTDDFLIRYDGITFAALWLSIFAAMYYGRSTTASVAQN